MASAAQFARVARLLREYGVTVQAAKGWRERGIYTLTPKGFIAHHTASGATSGNKAALPICTYGRSDLAGPLCNFHLARNGVVTIVAVGSANHAGEGGWRGLGSNSEVIGVEWENNGVGEKATPEALRAYHALAAACAMVFGFSSSNVCFHKEWAPTRKIDPNAPNFPSGSAFRKKVGSLKSNNLEEFRLNDADKTFLRNLHETTRQVTRNQAKRVIDALREVAEDQATLAAKMTNLTAKETERFAQTRQRLIDIQEELTAEV